MKEFIYRLRPSVSFIPIDIKNNRYDFFISNTRQNISLKLEDNLVSFVKNIDGTKSLKYLQKKYNIDSKKLSYFINYLIDNCIIEEIDTAYKIQKNDYRRIINFLGDYISTEEVLEAFEEICNSHVVIIGLGALGSWISRLLAQNGITNLTLLDNDIAKISNLNRSLFFEDNLGEKKIDAISADIKKFNSSANIEKIYDFLEEDDQLKLILENIDNDNILVINCADYPNVDITSEIVHKACMKTKTPYIIAGGYNLHLSLIGPTILPFESACYECMKLTLEELNNFNFKNLKKLSRKKRNLGNLAPLAGISASFVVNESVRILSNRIKPYMINKRGEYNFLTNEINFINLPRRKDCKDCGEV